ncbi:MAG: hypothetical protein KTR14_07180 [Vampirovibrio sp.]|nr:hypothetical protein [Vampirovibrio sp.]
MRSSIPAELSPLSVRKAAFHKLMSVSLALSIGLSGSLPVFAAPGDVNSVNDGQTVSGGTYYNTAGDKTTFVNSGSGGLWVPPDATVVGLEVNGIGGNPSENLTGNGGHLHFYAPGSVIRVDGTVDVRGLTGSGYATANGGRVTMDAQYIYQNGNIWADGTNGGAIVFNTVSVVFEPGSQT